MIPEGPVPDEGRCLNGNFLCGVVEGFYGKPWSTEQRKKLFKRMKKMGMNTYLYAPKDDCKHRMFWRDLYSVEEADHLTGLIENAKESSVDFVYALSPGLDITFSNSKDVMHLKRKLEQVASFGCNSFALLFDDIEVEMCEADKAVFSSFAHAQVSVSNETYQYLSQPKFLFCPTEYCATRAVPNVSTSEYLTTIGSKLLPGIDVMWTGPRVISKKISIESIEEVAKVLQRPPVIWDNIHANDYDPKRVFLGPYDGRLPELIPYLHGVLTNPNCEFEANYVAMHTLAQWSRSNPDGMKKDVILSSSPVTADIKLETETEDSTDNEDLYLHSSYSPHRALEIAITDWLDVIHSECKEPKKPVTHVQPPLAPLTSTTVLPTEAVLPPPVVASTSVPIPNLLAQAVRGVDNINELSALAEVNGSLLQPASIGPMNSLIDSGSSDSEDGSSVGEPAIEPMDCVVTPGSSPVSTSTLHQHLSDEVELQLSTDTCDTDTMQVEVGSTSTSTVASTPLTREEVQQLIDLFYLPLDHGNKAMALLNDFWWIKANAHLGTEAQVSGAVPEKLAEAAEWRSRCLCFQNNTTALMGMMSRFCNVPNKALVYDLFPYVWDLRETLSVVLTFVKWLVNGSASYTTLCYMDGPLWSNKAYRDAFLSGDHEPWYFRGGLQVQLQRMLMIGEAVGDLLQFTPPPTPCMETLNVRPYTARDEAKVYSVCEQNYTASRRGFNPFPEHPELIGDFMVGAMLGLSPELALVVEGPGDTLAGYVLATRDARQFRQKSDVIWRIAMHTKYPKPTVEEGLTPAQELIAGFYTDKPLLSDVVYQRYPARLAMALRPVHQGDACLGRRTLLCALTMLKNIGCQGVHVEIPVKDPAAAIFYAKLGFLDIQPEGATSGDVLYMGRHM